MFIIIIILFLSNLCLACLVARPKEKPDQDLFGTTTKLYPTLYGPVAARSGLDIVIKTRGNTVTIIKR